MHTLVVREHGGVVHLVNVVAGENEHIVGIVHVHEADVLVDGVRRALEPRRALRALVGREDVYAAVRAVKVPGLAVADVAVELQRAVLREHADGVDAGVRAVGKGKVDDAELPAERDGGLCHVLRQDVKAAALSAGEQHGDALFFHAGNSSLALLFFAFGFLYSPAPRRMTAPSGGMVMAIDCSRPCEGIACVRTGFSLRHSPVPPNAVSSVESSSRHVFRGGTPKR